MCRARSWCRSWCPPGRVRSFAAPSSQEWGTDAVQVPQRRVANPPAVVGARRLRLETSGRPEGGGRGRLQMKVDISLAMPGPEGAGERAAELAATGADGLFTFENSHDVFFPLVLASTATA